MKRVLGFAICLVLVALWTNSSIAQQNLPFGVAESQYPDLIPEGLCLYSSAVLSFDTQAFLDVLPGPLKSYSEEIDGRNWSAAETIRYNAMRYGINPQVILMIVEAQARLLRNPDVRVPMIPLTESNRQEGASFYGYVALISEYLFTSYYTARDDENAQLKVSVGEEIFTVPTTVNNCTIALYQTLAKVLSKNEWEVWAIGEEPVFEQQYSRWFGEVSSSYQDVEIPSALPEGHILPFTVGETWYYTSGPHNYVGGTVNCVSGLECPRPWSAIDIAPPEMISCPGGTYPSNRWIVASEAGTVIESSQALVVIDHNDGWRTYYSHIATVDRIEEGLVAQGQPIGHPSCEVEPGGSTSGVHLHYAIWQEGVGFVDINGSTLSNWVTQESTHYNGTMSRNSATRTASTGRLIGTNDILSSVILFSDTFSDSNLDDWTIMDATSADSAPSNWSIVAAKLDLVLLQDSNIHTLDPPYEGTYVYTGQSWWTDYYFTVEVDPDDNDGVFVLFRYLDDDNFYRFYIDQERSYRRLEKKVGGIYTTLAEDLTTGYGGGWINIQIFALGDMITVSLEHTTIFTATDNSLDTGKIGVGTWASTDCYFDNVIVATSHVDPYADAVVSANIKAGGNGHTDPLQVLGRPNGSNENDYVSIGGPGYWIVLDMGEGEEIIDGHGYDFRTHEIGSIYNGVDEEYNVSVSNSPDGPWVFVGEAWTTSEFDLAGLGLDSARYVRIDDLSTRTVDPYPGSDIDAVQSLNMVGDLILAAPENLSKTTNGDDAVLCWESVERASGYNIYASRSGGGIGFSQLDFVPVTTVGTNTNFVEPSLVTYTHQNAADVGYFYVVTALSPEGFESNFSLQVPCRIFLPIAMRN